MNSIEEIILTIGIGFVVATFLLNTGCAHKAIELCSESLVLLNNTGLSKEKQFGKLIYEGIYNAMFKAYCHIHDNSNAIKYGRKLHAIFCEYGDTVREGILSIQLAQIYRKQSKYAEAKELSERGITIMRAIGDKKKEAIAYGILGNVFRSLGEYIKAKEYHEKALAITTEMGDRKGVAACYGNLGTVFRSLGEYVKAEEYHEKALAIKIETSDREGIAASYGNLGALFQSLGKYVKAKEYHEKALAIRIETGNRAGEATDYGNLGNVFNSLGEYIKAKEYYEKALAIRMEIDDRAGVAADYGNLGTVFKSLGEYVKAREYHEKALAIKTEIGDREGEATDYGNLGTVFQSLGEYVKAKEYHEKALAITTEIGDRKGEAADYGNLGNMFRSLGEYVKAKEYLDKAVAIQIEIGDRAGEALSYGDLGRVFCCLGEYRKSKQYLDNAVAIQIEIGCRGGEASCYHKLGGLFQSLGDTVNAKEYYEKALAIRMEIGDRQGESITYVCLGAVFQSHGDYVMAEKYLEKAFPISKHIRCGEIEFQCYCFLTLTKLSQEKSQEAFSCLFRSIEKCEELRGFNEDDDQFMISFSDVHVFPYQRFCRLFCDTGNPNNALYVVELGRARALADLMATQYSVKKHISANPQSWIGIENVMKKESNCTCLYISYIDRKLFWWILKTSGFIAFREKTVDKNTLYTTAQPATNLDEFFAVMAKRFRGFGILPEEVCEDRSLNGIQSKPDSSQEESLPALRQGKNECDPELNLNLLYKMLIDPVSNLLEEPEIIIVPDRGLYRVPFPALRDESGRYLSETFKICIVPSLTTLKFIQDSPADYHSQTGALIVGDPKVGKVRFKGLLKTFSQLPGARKEAEMIGRMLGVQPLLGEHATKLAVLQRINSVSLIHFAAHGNAERGEIALAPALGSTTRIPKEDDYLLKMSDISQVQLRAKLVVLSCCHSGRGQIRAEGVVGIARAFLGSGARSVLVALWALQDSATEQLISRFYEHLISGESASESLHEAMKWMRDNGFTKVSEWAPLMLIGDNVTFMF
ncbi:hypothetical protein ACROYT_G008426 [Oculina patagonica]